MTLILFIKKIYLDKIVIKVFLRNLNFLIKEINLKKYFLRFSQETLVTLLKK